MKKTLVIVANASRARIFHILEGRFERIEVLTHPESRKSSFDLVSDRPGRAFDDTGGTTPQRSAMEPPTSAQELEMRTFARQLARRTEILARRGAYEELLVFAPARFLGRLKLAMNEGLEKRIVATVSHDYTQKTEHELADVLASIGVTASTPTPA